MYKSGLQSMESFREIIVFNKKDFFKAGFEKELKRFTKAAGDLYTINVFSPKIVETAAVITIFCIFILGYLFNRNLGELAQFLIVFAIAAYRIIPSINKLVLSFNYIKSSTYVFECFEKSDFDVEINKNSATQSESSLSFKNEIQIKNLSFAFPNQKEKVLNDINLNIQKSKTIGIIGQSGSGKTTLLNILLRLYEEQEGGILIDNTKVTRNNLQEWYRLVSYVPQNTTLLDGTILQNIAFGIEEQKTNSALLQNAIEKSLLKSFVESLPKGVHTQIGEKGIKISGGQRQRIGIARALYHGGEILIFDEATSALDYETESMVTESIDNLSQKTDLTVIIVAHRMQTLKYCDEIYKLENGSLVKA
jgi:ABC-type multidrug transport system fused ATPase/permease subunit